MTSCILHVLHLQREAADRPFEALEVGGERRRRVAEIANVLVALVDLELLPVELLLQVPNLKLQSLKLQVAGGCHVDQLFVVQIYRSALAICEPSAARTRRLSLAQRELAVRA